MQCPRCETASLTELDRDGVTIDRCEKCRGVWLDRGELEKLIAGARDDGRDRGDDDDDDDSDDRPRAGRSRHGHERDGGERDDGRRKRSWWEIFD